MAGAGGQLTVAVLILSVVVVALVVLRERDARQLERTLADAAVERASLLDRIQHPERRQVAVVHREPAEAPRDSAEMAFVGGFVPPGMSVGSVNGEAEDA